MNIVFQSKVSLLMYSLPGLVTLKIALVGEWILSFTWFNDPSTFVTMLRCDGLLGNGFVVNNGYKVSTSYQDIVDLRFAGATIKCRKNMYSQVQGRKCTLLPLLNAPNPFALFYFFTHSHHWGDIYR